jgi:hypothetical protein
VGRSGVVEFAGVKCATAGVEFAPDLLSQPCVGLNALLLVLKWLPKLLVE